MVKALLIIVTLATIAATAGWSVLMAYTKWRDERDLAAHDARIDARSRI